VTVRRDSRSGHPFADLQLKPGECVMVCVTFAVETGDLGAVLFHEDFLRQAPRLQAEIVDHLAESLVDLHEDALDSFVDAMGREARK